MTNDILKVGQIRKMLDSVKYIITAIYSIDIANDGQQTNISELSLKDYNKSEKMGGFHHTVDIQFLVQDKEKDNWFLLRPVYKDEVLCD